MAGFRCFTQDFITSLFIDPTPFSRHASPYGHYMTSSSAHNSRHTYNSITPLLIHYTHEFTICCSPADISRRYIPMLPTMPSLPTQK